MASISSLLNPAPADPPVLPSPSISMVSMESKPVSKMPVLSPPFKKQKIAKDAALFTRHKVQGVVRYPPYEDYDKECRGELEKFSVKPLGEIKDFRRHIPYNSDKKTFQGKTGRDAFEVYQYTFRIPNDEKEYHVMWDYNVGLVRITPFFKCLQYGKTIPSKMMGYNPGLKDICHSITGGAISAQGYWMPYEAARAVTATFCYAIRYALVPLFGPGYPEECVKPSDERFAQMVIDPRIVRRCTQQAIDIREQSSREGSAAPSTAPTLKYRPIHLRDRPDRVRHLHTGSDTTSEEPGYDTEREQGRESNYLPSPTSILLHTAPPRSAPDDLKLPSPRSMLTEAALFAHDNSQQLNDSRRSSGDVSPKTLVQKPRRAAVMVFAQNQDKLMVEEKMPALDQTSILSADESIIPTYEEGPKKTRSDSSMHAVPVFRLPPLYSHDNRVVSGPEARAAYTLLSLYASHDAAVGNKYPQGRKRRASH